MVTRSIRARWTLLVCLLAFALVLTFIAVRFRAGTGQGGAGCTSTVVADDTTLAEELAQIQAGDTLCLSGTFAERIVLTEGGTAAAPITIRSLDPVDPAVLDLTGMDVPEGDQGIVELRGSSHVRIEGLELTGWQTDQLDHVPAGILLTSEGTTAIEGVALVDNVIHDVATTHGITFTEAELADCEGWDRECIADELASRVSAFGIAVKGRSSMPITDLVISGNELADLTLGASEALVVNGNVDTFEISQNLVHDVNNIAIDAIGYEDLDAYPDDFARDQTVARGGVITGNRVWNVSSDGNPAYGRYDGNGQVSGYDRAAVGIYIDGGRDNRIEGNTIVSADIGVEVAAEFDYGETRDNIVRGNIIAQAEFAAISIGGYAAETPDDGQVVDDAYNGEGDAIGTAIVSNTVYSATPGSALTAQFRVSGSLIANNILAAPVGQALVVDDPDTYEDNVAQANLELEVGEPGANRSNVFVSADLPEGDALQEGGAALRDFLHLAPDSAGVDAGRTELQDGTPVPLSDDDIDGDPRLNGLLDLGADELTVDVSGTADTVRVSEQDPIEFSIDLSRFIFAGVERPTVDHVVLGRQDVFVDSFAAGPLLGGGPLLYVPGGADGTLPDAVADELTRLLASGSTVYLLGGVNAVGPAVAADVEELELRTVRLAGAERIATAVAIANEVVRLYGRPAAVLLATTGNWPDAIAGASLAARAGRSGQALPIVLTDVESLPPATAGFLEAHPRTQVRILGGTAVVSDEVASQTNADRLAGTTRTGTALAVARAFEDPTSGATLIQGYGDAGWIQGIAGAALAQPLVLLGPTADTVDMSARMALAGRRDLVVLGGSDQVSAKALSAAETGRN